VIFADDAGEPADDHFRDDVYGFYWTEGLRGLGWARDAVPTLKGGSTIGIASPPAIWNRAAPIGHRIVTPTIDEAEQLQGFTAGWTEPADTVSARKGTRWKLIGNAVTVGVSEWVAGRLVESGSFDLEAVPLRRSAPWPQAAFGANGKRWAVDASMWPLHAPYRHLGDVVDLGSATPLSTRATAGFLDRANRGTLRMEHQFLDDLASHVDKMAAA
jgi:DNA (cytosine-5)-methyltransferase 1